MIMLKTLMIVDIIYNALNIQMDVKEELWDVYIMGPTAVTFLMIHN